MNAAKLDSREMGAVMQSIRQAFAVKNELAKSLRFRYLRASKRFDQIREIVLAKAAALGLQPTDVDISRYTSNPLSTPIDVNDANSRLS